MRADGSSRAASICCQSSLSGISPFAREVVERVGTDRGSCSAADTGAAVTDATGAGVGQGLGTGVGLDAGEDIGLDVGVGVGVGVGLDATAGIDLCVRLNASLTNGP